MWVECMDCGELWDDDEDKVCPKCGSTDSMPAVDEDDDMDEEGK